MELSERYIKALEQEYPHVYEWQDKPGKVYEEHEHQGKTTVWLTDGSITFNFNGESVRGTDARGCQSSPSGDDDNLNSFCKKKIIELKAGDRFDVPPKTKHSAVVGPDGWVVIVAEEIENDS